MTADKSDPVCPVSQIVLVDARILNPHQVQARLPTHMFPGVTIRASCFPLVRKHRHHRVQNPTSREGALEGAQQHRVLAARRRLWHQSLSGDLGRSVFLFSDSELTVRG